MPDLVFSSPVALSDHYEVPLDTSPWPAPCAYHRIAGHGQTPDRPAAPFGAYGNSLQTRPGAQHYDDAFGVYILAIDTPHKAFYVGIASDDQKSPEGVGRRIRKHRVKLTGSHVGPSHNNGPVSSCGGVNHTGGWRPFAVDRHQYHATVGLEDRCLDVRLMVGAIVGGNPKKPLECYESAILHNANGIRDQLYAILWPRQEHGHVYILNTIKGRAPHVLPGNIILPVGGQGH